MNKADTAHFLSLLMDLRSHNTCNQGNKLSKYVEHYCRTLLSKMNKTTCKLDPFCTSIIMQYPQYFIHVYVYIINLCFSCGVYLTTFKSAKVKPLLKKPGLACEILKNLSLNLKLTFFFYQNSLKR